MGVNLGCAVQMFRRVRRVRIDKGRKIFLMMDARKMLKYVNGQFVCSTLLVQK